jgi:hypothetical protein
LVNTDVYRPNRVLLAFPTASDSLLNVLMITRGPNISSWTTGESSGMFSIIMGLMNHYACLPMSSIKVHRFLASVISFLSSRQST